MEVAYNVSEILEQADEGQEIILEPEGECEDGEVEEIIEIIEEIEEDDENDADHAEEQKFVEEETQEESAVKYNNSYEEVAAEENEKVRTAKVEYTTYEESNNHSKTTHHVNYDASADWEDEDSEQCERIVEQPTSNEEYNNYETYSNGTNSKVVRQHKTEDSRVHYDQGVSQENSLDGENSQPEIIQSSENNLIYTVLGSKNQTKSAQQNRLNTEYVQVQKYGDDQLPESEPVYYALNEEDGTYQAVQAIEEGQQQYEYVAEPPTEQDNQEWEASNQNVENQEQAEQDQIYLHEDENGQLYFKNQHGQLQPVYLTSDGNYAIAENSSDEQESQGGTNDTHEEQMDTDNYVLPDLDVKQFTSKKRKHDHSQDMDDDTLTISMIISEDEHGQKRTQVIIPTLPESKCNICNKTFKSSLQLLKHNRLKHAREEDITTRNFPCDLCPKRFSDQNSLARHRKAHTEQRPFQCLECHESFPTANTLRKHLQLHNPDSLLLLPCIYCGRKFSDKASLTRHEQSHLAGEKRMHVCDICQKCFSNLNDLNIHKKNHDPDRKFDCEVCGREFNRLNNLQRHMMVHQQQGASEEILSCNVCGITYKFSSSLTRHMVTTHMNPEKLRQQAEEQRKKRENHYRRYLENRKAYATQQVVKRPYRRSGGRLMDDQDEDADLL